METRAYLIATSQTEALVTVHENATMYHPGTPLPEQFWTYPFTDDGRDYILGAEPQQPYADADRLLADNGWRREGPWAVGDVVNGTYARVSRA